MNFAETLKKIRIEKGYSQQSLAKKAGVSQTAVYSWEKGERKPKLEQLRRIATALDVTIGELNPNWGSFSTDELSNDILELFTGKGGLEIDTRETRLNELFYELNSNGQDKAIEQVELLTKIPIYRADISDSEEAYSRIDENGDFIPVEKPEPEGPRKDRKDPEED